MHVEAGRFPGLKGRPGFSEAEPKRGFKNDGARQGRAVPDVDLENVVCSLKVADGRLLSPAKENMFFCRGDLTVGNLLRTPLF